MKLQRLQNKVLRNIGNLPRRTPVLDLHLVFKISYAYDYTTNYAGNKQKSYKIMMRMFAILDKAKPDMESIRGLNLATVKHMTVQVNTTNRA
jgi:hypothetical protein